MMFSQEEFEELARRFTAVNPHKKEASPTMTLCKHASILDEALLHMIRDIYKENPEGAIRYYLHALNDENTVLTCAVIQAFPVHSKSLRKELVTRLFESEKVKKHRYYDEQFFAASAVLARFSKYLPETKNDIFKQALVYLPINLLNRFKEVHINYTRDVVAKETHIRRLAVKTCAGFISNPQTQDKAVCMLLPYLDYERAREFGAGSEGAVARACTENLLEGILFSIKKNKVIPTDILQRCIESSQKSTKSEKLLRPNCYSEFMGYMGVVNNTTYNQLTRALLDARLLTHPDKLSSGEFSELSDETMDQLTAMYLGNNADVIIGFLLQRLESGFDFVACRLLYLHMNSASDDKHSLVKTKLLALVCRETHIGKKFALFSALTLLRENFLDKEIVKVAKELYTVAVLNLKPLRPINEQLQAITFLRFIVECLPEQRKESINLILSHYSNMPSGLQRASRSALSYLMQEMNCDAFCERMLCYIQSVKHITTDVAANNLFKSESVSKEHGAGYQLNS